jgi:hypothetical protein
MDYPRLRAKRVLGWEKVSRVSFAPPVVELRSTTG